jgi:60 kDa SS-A/Ro ribonucleoprotein
MNKINTSFLNETITQTEKLDDSQILNPAGGYVWQIDEMNQIRRFLMLGLTGGTYYAGERELTLNTAKVVSSMAISNGSALVEEIVKISVSGDAAKQDPLLFALAVAATKGSQETKKMALAAMQVVCRIGTHLFTFVNYYDKLGGGWGRGMRNAVTKWYNDKSAGDLVYQITKYQQRGGWSHRDLLRLSHPRPVTSDHDKIFRYAVKGELQFAKDDVMDDAAFSRLEAIIQAKGVRDERTMLRLILTHNLMREHVPTELQTSPLVQEALLNKMPFNAMIRNLNRMTASGLVAPMSNASKLILSKLTDEDALRKARVHPFNVLVALKTYASGAGVKGSLTWNPVQQIVDSLDDAFYATFKNVKPTGKNFLLGVDVSSSMTRTTVNGAPGITPRVAAAAMALVTANVEKNHLIMGFSTQFVDLKISPNMRLDTVIDKIAKVPFGRTDCAQPMLYAAQNNIPIDTFAIYTDNETYYGNVHPAQALKDYRKKMHRPSKLITCAFSGGKSTIADPNDAGMIDLAGFDSAAPQLIREFSLGNI